MKKSTLVLFLLLCVTLSFALASCGKKTGDATTAPENGSGETTVTDGQSAAETTAEPIVTTIDADAAEAERIAALEAAWEHRFDGVYDPNLKEAIVTLFDAYDAEGIIRWWAGLYDPEIGGFYYPNSGRDNEGFLPDMESTYQISSRIRDFVENNDLRAYFGEEISNKIIAFYQSRQDPDDGYFYHPQWSKETSRANVMRYTRDLDWATTMLGWLGAEPLYPTAYDRLEGKTASNTNEVTIKRLAALKGLRPTLGADWAPNVTSVTNYVNNLLVTKSTESWSNTLSTQLREFEAAGMLDTVLDILDTKAHPTYGCWVSGYNESSGYYYDFQNKTETAYGVYTAAYKILVLYQAAARPVPYPIPLAQNAVKTILSEAESIRITYLFNPWATLGLLRKLLVTVQDSLSLSHYDSYMKQNAVNMVTAATHTLAVYRQEDGSFSFLPTGSSPTIYGTPVAVPGTKEGDVNANNLAISFATHICTSLGVDGTIPIFSYQHGVLFRELLDNAPSIVKQKNQLANGTPATFDFNGDTVGSQPSSGTITAKTGTAFTVKNDPVSGSANRVLEIRKNTEGDNDGGLITFPTVTNYAQNDDAVMVSEFKLYIDGSTRFGNSISNKNSLVIMQVRYYAGGSCIYMPCFTFNNSDNPTGFYYNVGKSTSGGFVEKPDEGNAGGRRLFQFDTWYTFRLEFTMKKPGQTGQEFCVSVYVNGEKFCDSYCFYSDSDTSGATSGTLTVKTGTLNVRFAPQRRINGLIYLDDIKAEFKQ